MNKKAIKGQHSISIEKFLRLYCQIDNESIIETLSLLSHKELKKICREVYGINLYTLPFETVEQEDISIGDVILVNDRYGNLAPYKNPYKSLDELLPTPSYTLTVDHSLDYDEILDIIENNLTIEDVDISKIGSFSLPSKIYKKGR